MLILKCNWAQSNPPVVSMSHIPEGMEDGERLGYSRWLPNELCVSVGTAVVPGADRGDGAAPTVAGMLVPNAAYMRASIDAMINLAMVDCTDSSSIDWKEEVTAAGGVEVEWVAQLVGGPRTVAITVVGSLRVGGVPPGDVD